MPIEDGNLPELGPHPPQSDDWRRNDTKLFVGIAAFRDQLCGRTLLNLFTKATYPERLFVGVVDQRAAEDKSCLEVFCDLLGDKERCKRWGSRVHIYHMPAGQLYHLCRYTFAPGLGAEALELTHHRCGASVNSGGQRSPLRSIAAVSHGAARFFFLLEY